MSTVTGRIKEIKQPKGGYVKPSMFTATVIEDENTLYGDENIHATIIGMSVDYLTRFVLTGDRFSAFDISLKGASTASGYQDGSLEIAKSLLDDINGLDDQSIINACKLATFDVWFRNLPGAFLAKGYSDTNPDKYTVNNIRIMVERSMRFWDEYGAVIVDGFTFGDKGYTETVSSGDGDYLTADTLWDFKVSKSKPTNKHTLQLLMYWIMGQHSQKDEFKGITKIGMFNPRLNTVYLLDICDISQDVIESVETEVICY